jgi:predicted dehydrogenase
MNQRTYRAGIIGLGFIGGGDQVSGDRIGQKVANLDGTHRETFSKNARVELVAGCDFDAGRRERFAQRTSARTYDDWRAMLETERPDIVGVATYSPSHAELTIGCAEAGVRAVYCEKPIASSLAEADAMIAACEQAGSLLVINHNRRFNPNYRRLRELIAAGELGELTSVSLRWSTGRLGCVGTHFFDAARMLTSRDIVAVSATLDLREKADCRGSEFHDPGGWGVLKMEGGLMTVVNAANYALGPGEVVIDGTLGRAIAGGDPIELKWHDGRHEVWPGTRREATSMDRALDEIIAWLDEPSDFSTPAREALQCLEAIIGFHISHKANAAWIDLPLTGANRQYQVIAG